MKKSVLRTNKNIDWDTFNARAYWQQHFTQPGAEDVWVLERMLSFATSMGLEVGSVARAADIGTGPSLILPLASSIFARKVDLLELGAQNIAYLKEVLSSPANLQQDWLQVQQIIANHPQATPHFGHALKRLYKNATVLHTSADDAPKSAYDIVTSVFCAESATEDIEECACLIQKIFGSLKKGGLYATAYIEGSKGYPDYSVGRGGRSEALKFPSATISQEWLANQFASTNIVIERCPFVPAIRAGYTGVLLAIGVK